ncbi:DUF2939 domain-containing protein [uncultured Brevundimonas sp.]|uniref:DUF2939 domain-containing protein n=1 Tax=uncultured Brevundimonas sp. TaxID=213418 RepID=UPI0030EDA3DA|tara:strand:- start:1910 stop:2485 length:576 start_codon:yes stop_codon:yes gene_type:complete
MNRKLLTGGLIALIAAFLVAYFASPVLAVRGLTEAARSGDEAALRERVDFPAFRASLKEELNGELVARMRADPRSDNPVLSGLGMLLAPSLVSGMVDAFVTPGAIATMVRSARAPDPMHRPDQVETPERAAEDKDTVRQSWAYRDLNTFAVTLTNSRHPDQHLALLMERRGLFDWKLAGIDLTAPSEDDAI